MFYFVCVLVFVIVVLLVFSVVVLAEVVKKKISWFVVVQICVVVKLKVKLCVWFVVFFVCQLLVCQQIKVVQFNCIYDEYWDVVMWFNLLQVMFQGDV